MSTKRDYYEVLGLSRDVDGQSLKKAYRRLALEYHPDRNPDQAAVKRFREIQEAYDVLSDPEKRSLYDQFGHAGLEGRLGGSGFGNMEDIFGGFQTIFEDFFGGGRAHAQARGRDLRYRLTVSFREAALGGSRTISVKRNESCDVCFGSGCESGTSPEPCSTCKGRGKIQARQGFFVVSQSCPRCHGTGKFISKPCKSCHGNGLKEKKSDIEVNIPAGVDTGVRLRLSGSGEALSGTGPKGDLYVEIEVEEDDTFQRDGANLYTQVYVPYPIAVLGGEIEVPLLEGQKKIKVPKHMKSPFVSELRHEGVVDLRSNRRGSLFLELHIATPDSLSPKAKELIEELQIELQSGPVKGSKGEKQKPSLKKKSGFFRNFL